jgi:hypothetical protein
MRTPSRTLLLALVGAALIPSAAHAAAPTKIGFDGIAANTYVTDQYLASDGVEFGHPSKYGITDGPLGGPDYIPDNCSGAVYGVDPGINGRSVAFNCGNETSTTNVTTIHFTTFRRGASFVLRSPTGSHGSVRIRTYVKGKIKADDRTLATPRGQNVNYSISRSTADITNIVIVSGGSGGIGPILLDDVSAPVDDVPPPAAFELGDPKPLEVAEGGTAKSTLPVVRYNGSTGPIGLSVSPLPAGIAAVNAEPNPVTGNQPAQLAVTARPRAIGKSTLTVTSANGPAGEFLGGPVKQEINAVTALEPQNTQAGVVEQCGTGEAQPGVRIRGGYRGRVDVKVEKESGPVTVINPESSFQALGNGGQQASVDLQLKKGEGGQSVLKVTFTPENATPVVGYVRVFDYHVSLGNVKSSWGKVPETVPGPRGTGFGNGGDRVVVEGRFPGGCMPRFEDGVGRRMDIIDIQEGGPDTLGKVTLKLPKDPVSGWITAKGAEDVVLSRSIPGLELTGFRNGPGLRNANSGGGAGHSFWTWDAFRRTFGDDDAEICYAVGCGRDPIAVQFWKKYRGDLQDNKGVCFGYSTVARLIDKFGEPWGYEKSARRGWDIQNFMDGQPIKEDVVRWQMSQKDPDWKDYREDNTGFASDQALRDRIVDQLRNQDAVTVRVKNGDDGHAMVAYDLRDLPGGGFEILTYNPNYPYTTAEQTDVNALNAAVANSAIKVIGGRWTGAIQNADGTWWTGGLNTIGVLDRLPPGDADLPGNLSLAGLASALDDASSGGAKPRIASITAGGTDALRPDGTAKPGTGVEEQITDGGGEGSVEYALTPGRTYELGVTGGAGGYMQSLLSRDVATTVTTRGRNGDRVLLTPGQAQIGLKGTGAASAATFDLAARKGKVTRTAAAVLTAGRGTADTIAFTRDRNAVTVAHTGAPTTVAVTLGSIGQGVPGGVSVAPIKVGGGERLELKPGSWTNPAAGVGFTVRDGKGKVKRRGRARLQAAKTVAFGGGLTAKLGRGGTVTVAGRIAKAGAAPLLAVTAEAVRGGKVVKKATVLKRAARAGAFSVPVVLKGMPKGAKVRVNVSLVDQGGAMATARKTTTAR